MVSYSLLGDESAWLNVFAKLDLKSLVKCRNVCRSWREMIDLNLQSNTLVLHTDAYPCQRWSFDNEPLNSSESLQVPELNRFLASSLVKTVLKNIRKLIVYCHQFGERIIGQSFDMNALNNFTELRQLEIFKFESDFNARHCRLVLGKLKFLKFGRNPLVELETPRLSTVVGDSRRLQLNYPAAVRVLKIDYCGKKTLEKFVNLQYLFCKTIEPIEDDFLLNLKNLKAILFYNYDRHGGRPDNVFHKLHKQKQKLNRKNLRIQFLGIEFEESEFPICDLDPWRRRFNSNKRARHDSDGYSSKEEYLFQKLFSEYELNEQSCKIYFTNSSKIAPVIPFVKRLQFKLVDLNRDKLQFFRKFIGIREIIVDCELANVTFFLKFIQNQNRLQTLRFNNSKFTQSHFDVLDRFVPRLTELSVLNEPKMLCFDFALKLQNLVVLKTDQSIRFETVKRLSAKQPNSIIFFSHHSSQIQKSDAIQRTCAVCM